MGCLTYAEEHSASQLHAHSLVSAHRRQAGPSDTTAGTWPPCPGGSGPARRGPRCHSRCLSPTGFLKLHSTQNLHSGGFRARPPSVQQRRDQREGWDRWERPRDCTNPPGSQEPGATIVSVPVHLHGVAGLHPGAPSYPQGHWSTGQDTRPEPILAPNKGSEQDQPGIATHSWLPIQSCSG